MKNFFLWISLLPFTSAAYVMLLTEDYLETQLQSQLQNITADASNFDLLFSAAENFSGEKGTSEALSQHVRQFKGELNEDQYMKALSFFMDLGEKKEITHIFSEALPMLAKFSVNNNEITCDSYIFQGLLVNRLYKEISQLVKEINHPICSIQATLLENSAVNNIRPKKELWLNLIDKAVNWPSEAQKDQALYYLAEEISGYESWSLFPLLVKNTSDEKTLFKIYTLYFNRINEAERIPQKTHNQMIALLKKDVQQKSQNGLKDAALALQAAGFVPQMQALLAPNLNDIDERFLFRLIIEFARAEVKNYALALEKNIKDDFVKANAYVAFTQYFGTQPLAGDDPYLDATISKAENLRDINQKDYIFLQLMEIALISGATDTAFNLASYIKNDIYKELSYTLLALSLNRSSGEIYGEKTVEYIVKNKLPPFLSTSVMNRLLVEQKLAWFEVMVQFSSFDNMKQQLNILNKDSHEYNEPIVDMLISSGRNEKAGILIEDFDNPWLKIDKLLNIALSENGEAALIKALNLLDENTDLSQSHAYLSNITYQLLLLEQNEHIQKLYKNTSSAAQKVTILTSLLSYIRDDEAVG